MTFEADDQEGRAAECDRAYRLDGDDVSDLPVAGAAPEWFGRGADLLNLSGNVKDSSFRNLLAGFPPDGKKPFTQNPGPDDRKAGWDLTFSAPKSVAVLWSRTTAQKRKALEHAHKKAISQTLSYLEEERRTGCQICSAT
jgi:conjugative relaxase-like TrwC/TraI family protein